MQKTNTDHPRGQQRQKTGGIHPQVNPSDGRVSPFLYVHHMRRSSLGNGRGRPGFSDPADAVCFLSSALGLYVPSVLLFFLMTHISSSRAKLRRDSTVDTNTDSVGGINTCVAMVTDSSQRNRKYRSGLRGLCSHIWANTASVR